MIILQHVTKEVLQQGTVLLFIYTPFCGTCRLAESMLRHIEAVHQKDIFYKMNASYYESFMQHHKIESVPCLLILVNGQIKEKIYSFPSMGMIYEKLLTYRPSLFENT